ncbi:hypothetical protein BDB01DRAFT_864680 [Pilobolus umbonatus]|nr:hypothetical protein BDB01DRAFT_864680 [Pilobolus umbonatus]
MYINNDPLYTAIIATAFIALVHYVVGEVTENLSQVDRVWSILPIIYAWHFTYHDYLLNKSFHPRLLVASILITIWGIRLTYNLARKGGYRWSDQDYRFTYLRKKLGNFPMTVLNLVFVAFSQDFLLLLLVTPLYMVYLFSTTERPTLLSSFDWSIVVLHLMFLLIEAVADEQQYVFQVQKHALMNHLNTSLLKGDYRLGFLCNSGLFRFSRHPNFFAEVSMWWVIYLFSVSTIQEVTQSGSPITYFNWTIVGPILLTLLFQCSTLLTEVGLLLYMFS